GALGGARSPRTRVRLAPDAASPRRATPWSVGFATRDEPRRNSPKPGVARSASSSALAGPASRSVPVTTDVAPRIENPGAPRDAVTVSVSSVRTIRAAVELEPAESTTVLSPRSAPRLRLHEHARTTVASRNPRVVACGALIA